MRHEFSDFTISVDGFKIRHCLYQLSLKFEKFKKLLDNHGAIGKLNVKDFDVETVIFCTLIENGAEYKLNNDLPEVVRCLDFFGYYNMEEFLELHPNWVLMGDKGKFMLKAAKVNQMGNDSYSTFIACESGNAMCLDILISRGCRVDMKNSAGETALMVACRMKSIECMHVLADNWCDLDAEDNGGNTALLMACLMDYTEGAAMLLDVGCDANALSYKDETALMVACRKGNIDIMRMLIEEKCDINLANIYGKTALDIARELQHIKCSWLLIGCGCDYQQIVDNDGNILQY